MSTSDAENRSRDLYQVLSEATHTAGWWHDPHARKRLAKKLAEEDIPVDELRRRCQRLSRVDEWVRILVRKKRKQDIGQTNAMTSAVQASSDRFDADYIVESVRTDGKTPEWVAEQMGWPLSKVEEVLAGSTKT